MSTQNTAWVTVRFERRIVRLVDKVSATRGEDRSSFVRMAVKRALASLSYLEAEEKKAIGIKEAARTQ